MNEAPRYGESFRVISGGILCRSLPGNLPVSGIATRGAFFMLIFLMVMRIMTLSRHFAFCHLRTERKEERNVEHPDKA